MPDYSDIINIVGGAKSNSYVSGTEADEYAEFQSWNDTWAAKSESERTIALVNACRWLDTIDFGGNRCSPSTTDETTPQSLMWPRSDVACDGVEASCSFIPKEIKEAQILIAYNLVVNPEMITGPGGGSGGDAPAGTYISSQELGELKVSYAAYPGGESSSNDCIDCSTPDVIAKLPWLKGLLGCWADISAGSSKVLLRVRS